MRRYRHPPRPRPNRGDAFARTGRRHQFATPCTLLEWLRPPESVDSDVVLSRILVRFRLITEKPRRHAVLGQSEPRESNPFLRIVGRIRLRPDRVCGDPRLTLFFHRNSTTQSEVLLERLICNNDLLERSRKGRIMKKLLRLMVGASRYRLLCRSNRSALALRQPQHIRGLEERAFRRFRSLHRTWSAVPSSATALRHRRKPVRSRKHFKRASRNRPVRFFTGR